MGVYCNDDGSRSQGVNPWALSLVTKPQLGNVN